MSNTKKEAYCSCSACVCRKCKKPFATWTKNQPSTFETESRFDGICKECYKLSK